MALVCLFSDNFSYFRHTGGFCCELMIILQLSGFYFKTKLGIWLDWHSSTIVRDISNVIVYNMRSFSVCIIFIICIININIIAMQKRYL